VCSVQFSSVQFSSVQMKMVSIRSEKPRCAPLRLSQKFSQRCFWNYSSVCLTDDGPLSSFQGRSSSASSFHASLLQAIGVVSLALCPQVVSQASQHFRSSEKEATCEGCFAQQSISSVISLHSGMLCVNCLSKTLLYMCIEYCALVNIYDVSV